MRSFRWRSRRVGARRSGLADAFDKRAQGVERVERGHRFEFELAEFTDDGVLRGAKERELVVGVGRGGGVGGAVGDGEFAQLS